MNTKPDTARLQAPEVVAKRSESLRAYYAKPDVYAQRLAERIAKREEANRIDADRAAKLAARMERKRQKEERAAARRQSTNEVHGMASVYRRLSIVEHTIAKIATELGIKVS